MPDPSPPLSPAAVSTPSKTANAAAAAVASTPLTPARPTSSVKVLTSPKPKSGGGSKKKKAPAIAEDNKTVRTLIALSESASVDGVTALVSNGESYSRLDLLSGGAGEALVSACTSGHIAVADVLLSRGADVVYRNGRALQMAARYGQAETVTALIRRYNADAFATATTTALTPLQLAIVGGSMAVVDVLVSAYNADGTGVDHSGVAVNINDRCGDVCGVWNGWTALHFAADGGYVDILNALTARGADVTTRNANGDSALSVAAECGHWEFVAAILERDAAEIASTRRGLTAVEWAVYRGEAAVVEKLISRGGTAHLEVRPKWLDGGRQSLGEYIFSAFSQSLYEEVEMSIFRGVRRFAVKQARLEALMSFTWNVATDAVPAPVPQSPLSAITDGEIQSAKRAAPTVPMQFPMDVATLIAQFES